MEIILVRHGRPNFKVNNIISASGFSQWVRYYNKSNVCSESTPPNLLSDRTKSFYVVSSDLSRAIHSAVLCVDKSPDLILKELREMDIPRFKFPLKLKATHWLIISRLLWFFNVNTQVESFKRAKLRVKLAASKLVELTKKHDEIVVFSHGLINKYLSKELIKLGWSGTYKRQSYWGATTLKKD
jgi:broad specificity phosphatase PhoE